MIKDFGGKPIDHYTRIFLMELENELGDKAFTFAQNGGREVIKYDRLLWIYEMIGLTLKQGKEEYEGFKKWYDNQPLSK